MQFILSGLRLVFSRFEPVVVSATATTATTVTVIVWGWDEVSFRFDFSRKEVNLAGFGGVASGDGSCHDKEAKTHNICFLFYTS